MNGATSTASARRHDLDWLRGIAILLLVFFHSAMPFVAEWDWHIRNAETSRLLLELNYFVSRFRMALLFVIAGVAANLLLRERTVGAFLRDRAARLLVPLIVGIFVIVPPQVYFERVADGAFRGSFLAFWPRTLRFVPYPDGDTSYHHLWFIFYLYLYALMLVPLLQLARAARGSEALAVVRSHLTRWGVHTLGIPIVMLYALLTPWFSGSQNVVDDIAMFVVYFLYFITGWIVGNDLAIWRRIQEGRHRAFRAAVLMLLVILATRWSGGGPSTGFAGFAWRALLGAHAWAWVIALLGFGYRWLNRDHAILRWSRDAAYPVYILHQTVIVAVAAFAVRQDEPVAAKFLFTAGTSLLLTVATYEALVRPFPVVRRLFGLVPRRLS